MTARVVVACVRAACLLVPAALVIIISWPGRIESPPRRPICEQELPELAEQTAPVDAWVPVTTSLHNYGFGWIRKHHGHITVWAASSSRLREDQSDATHGGLPEVDMSMAQFLDSISSGARPQYDYVKMLDNSVMAGGIYYSLDVLGQVVEKELRAALTRKGVWYPDALSWSLWIGAKGSTTAMHVDDHHFNMLYVVRGLKRLVLIDHTHPYLCSEPAQNPTACWVHWDILSSPPPESREVLLGAGQAFILPASHWHAVENLEPTIAVGINEDTDCSIRRYARLTGPYTGFRLNSG